MNLRDSVQVFVSRMDGITAFLDDGTPISQEVAIQPGGDFSSADVEAIGNRAAEVSQDIAERVSRALVLPPFAVGANPELPMPVANALLAWDAVGGKIENKAIVALDAVAFPVSSTDNAISRWDGTGGNSLQDSVVTIDDNGAMAGLTGLTITGNIAVSGTVDGRNVSDDGAKLDAISASGSSINATINAFNFMNYR